MNNRNDYSLLGSFFAGVTIAMLTLAVLGHLAGIPDQRAASRFLPKEVDVIQRATPEAFRAVWKACENASPCEDRYGECRIKHMQTCLKIQATPEAPAAATTP